MQSDAEAGSTSQLASVVAITLTVQSYSSPALAVVHQSIIMTTLRSHLLFHILAILSLEQGTCHALVDPVPSFVYPEGVSFYASSSTHGRAITRTTSNWTRRADGEVEEDVICHPAGSCEACPDDLLQEPYCQPFGNRRLLHCRVVSSSTPNNDVQDSENAPDRTDGAAESPPSHNPADRPPQSALPAWESCGRRVPKERADFFEFVLCNVIFAALALTGVLIRSERMRAVRARRLAARIGVGLRRASSGSWAAMGGMGAALVGTDAQSAEGEELMREDASGS
ncbi:uncharacterized protein FOMMEDRAFT_165854 [Fomitiporia mediterranea MF3/22]|uniref:uncharacterized protein n=1 Tax=Fomitiporia mediterranea (strain MF3/22) TaxID=694068 RepID=UPI00044094B3|nr:uncharacterized protein FOMMEDRAFT_165854 [Fomitiporia mediterranea MF3/22]EJD05424.1 hypothetical protein FOMMEDRAFT_165854 [Fomitiporia mediterranea MF3/22]